MRSIPLPPPHKAWRAPLLLILFCVLFICLTTASPTTTATSRTSPTTPNTTQDPPQRNYKLVTGLGEHYHNHFKQFSNLLLFFTADGCTQCQHALTAFEQANKAHIDAQYAKNPQLKEHSVNRFVLINCSEQKHEKLCSDYLIEGFPTITSVRYPTYYEEYTGPREQNALLRFFKYSTLPMGNPLHNIQDYINFIRTDVSGDFLKMVLHVPQRVYEAMGRLQQFTKIRRGDPKAQEYPQYTPDLALQKEFLLYSDDLAKLSTTYRTTAAFAFVNQTTIQNALHFQDKVIDPAVLPSKIPSSGSEGGAVDRSIYHAYPTEEDNAYYLEIYRDFDEKRLEFLLPATTTTNLEEILLKHNLPRFGTISPSNYPFYLRRNVPMVWIFYDYTAKTPQMAYYNELFHQLTQSFRQDKVLFVKLDAKQYHSHAVSFGVQQNTVQIPGVVLEDRFNRKNYIFSPQKYAALTASLMSHVKETNEPTNGANNTIRKLSKSEKQLASTGFHLPALKAWLNEYFVASLQHTMRSEDPEKYAHMQNAPIIPLTGSNVYNFLMEKYKDRDIFVIYHTSWCAQTPKVRGKLLDILTHTLVGGNGVGNQSEVTYTPSQQPQNETQTEQSDDNKANATQSVVVKMNNTLLHDKNFLIAQLDISFNDLPFNISNSLDLTHTPELYLYQAGRNASVKRTGVFGLGSEEYMPKKYQYSLDTESLYHFIAEHRLSTPDLAFPIEDIAAAHELQMKDEAKMQEDGAVEEKEAKVVENKNEKNEKNEQNDKNETTEQNEKAQSKDEL